MKVKNFLISLIITSIVLTITSVSVSAEETLKGRYKQLLILGDSISTGYGLAGYTPGETPYNCPSYGNRLAEALSLKAGEGYINRAVNGDRSADLLALLPKIKGDVAESDLIVISIGGNDLLKILPALVTQVSGTNVTGFNQAVSVIRKLNSEKLASGFADAAAQKMINDAITGFADNMSKILKLLHEYNPEARVFFLEQYDPTHDFPEAGDCGVYVGKIIDILNLTLRAEIIKSGFGFETADIPSVINPNADGRTNIADLDIHPNSEGHDFIAAYMIERVSNERQPVVVITETTSQTEHNDPETAEVPKEETTVEITEKASEDTVSSATQPTDKKGCASSLTAGAMALLLAAFAVCLKKKE